MSASPIASNETLENSENITGNVEKDSVLTVPDEVYLIYFGFVIIGCLVNLTIAFGLLICKRNGVLSLILQLSFVDALSGYVAILEIWSIKNTSWSFPPDLCPLFAGSEVLTNTLMLYLVISFNFHVVSLINLQSFELNSGNKNPLTSCNEDDSNECLVKRSENIASRNITIDYRKRKDEVSVLVPSILIWFISLSLSIPEFTLASTIKLQNSTLCTVVDNYYGQLLQKLLLIFRVALPEPLLVISLVILLVKLYKIKSKQQLDNVLLKNAKSLLIFSLTLTIFYFATTLQRDVLYLQHTVTQNYRNDTIDSFKGPPFHNTYVSNSVHSLLSVWHYTSILIRPVLYVLFLSSFRTAIKNNIMCLKSDSGKNEL